MLILAMIKRLRAGYAIVYGREPDALFVPAVLVPMLIVACDELKGENIGDGFVIDGVMGLKVRVCTGQQLGVGKLREDGSTPAHDAVWIKDDGSYW